MVGPSIRHSIGSTALVEEMKERCNSSRRLTQLNVGSYTEGRHYRLQGETFGPNTMRVKRQEKAPV